MEFRYGLWRGVSPLYSENGRQLGEGNTRPFIFNDHVPAETVACKYEGSRYGALINISALRTAMAHFDDAMVITSAVSRSCFQGVQPSALGSQPGIWDLYIISRASIALIAYDKRRRDENRVSHKVPDVLTSQYQFITGIFMICRDMMNNADPAIAQNSPISAEDLFAYADKREIFTSFNGMVCAGSKAKILEFLEFCNKAALSSPDAAHAVNDQNSAYNEIKKLVSNPDDWRLYSLSTIEFDCFIEMEYLARQIKKQPENSKHHKNIQQIYRSLSEYCVKKFDLRPPNDHLNFADGALERQNAILKLLGRPTLSKIHRKYIEERLDY